MFLATYLSCRVITSLPPVLLAVAALYSIVITSTLALVAIDGGEDKLIMIVPQSVIFLTTLAAIMHFGGANRFLQEIPVAGILVIAILASEELNLQRWKVFLSFICLSSAVYFLLVRFPAM